MPTPNDTESSEWIQQADGDATRWKSPDGIVDVLVREVETANGTIYNCTALKKPSSYDKKFQVGSGVAVDEASIEETVNQLYEEAKDEEIFC